MRDTKKSSIASGGISAASPGLKHNLESGQIMVSLLLMLAIFLLAIVGFAVDLTNLWFHRQAAQTAADSACQAGAMDLEALAAGMPLPNMGFTPGTSADCSTGVGTICFYAKANGYNGAGIVANSPSNSVTWSFPASVPNVTTPPAAIASYPFLKVVVAENVKTHFLYTIHGTSYQQVVASCTCGTTQLEEAAPMIVLSPTAPAAFYYAGGAIFNIVGGPPRGLQVNSTSSTAVDCQPSGLIDTSHGGPKGTGSSVGISGGPSQAPTTCSGGGFNGGTTGGWTGAVAPVPDPYGGVGAPTKPALAATASEPHIVAYGQDGCPDHSPTNYYRDQTPHSGCMEFEPGYYPVGIPSGMKNFSLNANDVAIFKPGIYYMDGNVVVGGSDNVRMATPCVPSCSPYSGTPWQQTDGIMFYFHSGSLIFNGSAGSLPPRVDPVQYTSLTCDGSVPNSSLNMPSALNGNVLVAQCTADGTYWDSNGDTSDSRGNPGTRGLLVYQGHADTSQPTFGGSNSLSFSGALYFHSTGYGDQFSMTGTSNSGTFILGQIVADKVSLTGSGAINMALNPASSTQLLKVGMLQ